MLSRSDNPPRHLKIGGVFYKITVVDRLEDDDRAILRAVLNTYDCTIKVTSGMTPAAEMVELWHEVLHAIMTHAGQDSGPDALSERQVRALSHGVVQVLADNQWIGTLDGKE